MPDVIDLDTSHVWRFVPRSEKPKSHDANMVFHEKTSKRNFNVTQTSSKPAQHVPKTANFMFFFV